MSVSKIVFLFVLFSSYLHTQAMQQSQYLLRAAQLGNLNQIKELLSDPKTNINAQNSNGCTALHWAILCNHVIVVQELLKHGADTTIQTKFLLKQGDKYTALHLAVMKESSEIIELLLKQTPGLINMGNKDLNTPLHLAVSAQPPNLEIIKKLLDCGVLINAQNTMNLTALQMAEMLGHQDIIDLINNYK